MKDKNAMELLKLATDLACATISQQNYNTTTKAKTSETVLEDCLKAVQAHFHDLTSTK
jgi:hypothetical protein